MKLSHIKEKGEQTPSGRRKNSHPTLPVKVVNASSPRQAKGALRGLGFENDLAGLKDNSTAVLMTQRDYPTLSEEKWMNLFTALESNQSCTHLELRNVTLGTAACIHLGKALKAHSYLNYLDMSRNIGEDATELEWAGGKHIAQGLSKNQSLVQVKIENNWFGTSGYEYLAHWVSHSNTLGHLVFHVAFNEELNAVVPFVEALAKNDSLDSLVLRKGYGWPAYKGKDLRWDPSDASLGRAIASLIADNHHLKSLEVGFDARALKEIAPLAGAIAKNKTLTKLNLDFDWHETSDSHHSLSVLCESLSVNTTLTELTINSSAMPSLFKNLPSSSLQRVRIRPSPAWHPGLASHVHVSHILHAWTELKRMALPSLGLTDENVKEMAQALQSNNHSIECIELQGNLIGDEGIKLLARSLRKDNHLLFLDLSQNSIGDEGFKALGELMKGSPWLNCLNLSSNARATNEGVKAILAALPSCPALTKLLIRDVSFTADEEMKDSVAQNRSLQEILCTGGPAEWSKSEMQKKNAEWVKEFICERGLGIKVYKGRGMARKDSFLQGGKSDPYVKAFLTIQPYTSISTFPEVKSQVMRNTLNPEWGGELMTLIPPGTKPSELPVSAVRLAVEVWDWDAKGPGDFMGSVQGPGNPFSAHIFYQLGVPVWEAVQGRRWLDEQDDVKGRILYEVCIINGGYFEPYYYS